MRMQDIKICAIVPESLKVRPNTKRDTFDSFGYLGLRMIIDDVEKLGYCVDYVTIDYISEYDYALWSVTAVEDIISFFKLVKKRGFHKGKCKVIVGGAGLLNVRPIYDYVDIAVFGRGEGIIKEILDGKDHDSVWYKKKDPDLSGQYTVRQAAWKDPREAAIGCKNKCFFCQYTWTRKLFKSENYSAKFSDIVGSVEEEDFAALKMDKPGRMTTAFDGISEKTRDRVNKKFVTEAKIKEKVVSALDLQLEKAIMLKIFCIVGYPWETKKTVEQDLSRLRDLFTEIVEAAKPFQGRDRVQGRILAAFHFTPFSPSVLTPMQCCPANISINWRQFFNEIGRNISSNDRMEVFIDPYTNAPPTLAQRVILERATLSEKDKVYNIISSGRLDGVRGNEIGRAVTQYIGRDIFGWLDTPPLPYLTTYANVEKLGIKFFENKGTVSG